MMPEPLAVAVAVEAVSVSALFLVWRHWPTRSGRPAPKPRGERVPREVAPELVVPEFVACSWRICEECTARRYVSVYADGSFACRGCGHHQPEVAA